jgi:hypothetical protein
MAIEAMLPTTILTKDDYRRYVQSEKSASEIANMLNAYANTSGTSRQAHDSAKNAAEQINGTRTYRYS